MTRPHGHACYRLNICFDCGGELLDELGGHSEYYYNDGRVSSAAPVCHYCKMIHNFIEGAPTVPHDFDKRLAELRAKGPTSAAFAVALWTKTTIDEKEKLIKERRYVVNSDGTVVTRFDVCDLSRSLNSFTGDGWHTHTIKKPFKNVRQLLGEVDEALSEQGYLRLF